MEEFLNKLYSYDNFAIYLIISIVVLVLLFFIILFYGKKDQKKREIEATKKLEQINNENTFKEDSIVEKVEVPNTKEQLENDTIIVPTIEDIPIIDNNITEINNNENTTVNETPKFELPSENVPVTNEEIIPSIDVPIEPEKPVEEPLLEITQKPEEIVVPTIEAKPEITPIHSGVEEKPLVFNEINEIETNEIKMPTIEETKEEVSVPVFNLNEVVRNAQETKKEEQPISKRPEVFSSVYVTPKNEEIKEPVVKTKEESPVPTKEELDFELPVLKKSVVKEEKEEKIELPILNDYNLDDLSGETYTINK